MPTRKNSKGDGSEAEMNVRDSEPKLKLGKHFLELSVLILMITCLLAPNVEFDPNLILPIEVLMLPVICYLYFLLACMDSVRPLRVGFLQVSGALFSLSVLVSMFYGSTFLNHEILTRDYYEVVKVLLPVLFFTIAYEADLDDRALRRLLALLSFATLLVCLYGWAQFLNVPGTDRLNSYYSSGGAHALGLELERRVYSTLANPNVLGQFLSCALICYVLKFLSKVGNRIGSAIIALTIASTLVLTGSRYALIVSAFGLLLVIQLTFSGTEQIVKQLVSATLLLVVLICTFLVTKNAASDSQAARRFQELSHPSEVQSLRDREDFLWLDALEYFESSPIFGHGPNKAIFTGVWTDSEYLDVLKSYGMTGLALYLTIHLWVLIQLWRGLRAQSMCGSRVRVLLSGELLLVRFGFFLILAGLAMNIGMATYFNSKFNTVFWLILGIAVRSAHRMTGAAVQRIVRLHAAPPSRELNFLTN
jgi:O-antigen ligase